MKNRAMLLCLKHGIMTAEEYALKVGITVNEALDIFYERIIIPEDAIKRSCELFNVSKEYFLCITEREWSLCQYIRIKNEEHGSLNLRK